MAWKKEKFKTIIEHKSGYTWSKEQETKFPEPKTVRVLTVTNIQKELDLSSELYLKDVTEADKVKKAVSKDWSIAVSSNGNRSRIGNAVFIKEDSEYLFASFLTAFKPKEDADILPDYFFRWLTSHNIQERITAVSEGTTGLGNLDIRFLRNTEIKYPENPAEQTAIATLLSKVDEAIAATQNSIKAAEKLKKALMQNLLTGKLKPDGTWRSEDEFYEDEKFGKVPLGWEVKKLKDVFFVNPNSLPSQTDGNFTFRYITIEAVQTENIDFESCPEYTFKDSPGRARRIINDNDILISGVRPNLKAFAIYQKPNEENWICSTGFYVLTAKDEENHKYHFYQILSEIGESQFHSYVAGSNYPAIGDRDLKLLKLLRPPYDEQCLIEEKISSISIENSNKQTKIQTLQRLKKSLMQNLLTGKVRLPQEFVKQFEEAVEEVNKTVTAQ